MFKQIVNAAIILILVSSCAVIRQGEVGVKRKFGKISDNPRYPGVVGYNPFTSTVLRIPIRTVNLEIRSNLPSKEGLTIGSEISILYSIMPEKVPHILGTIGRNYEDVMIKSVFRSASADVCARFFAKDMHTAQRATIEKEIQARMSELLSPRGFIIEAVLLKTIMLPGGLARAVEEKLEAEQDAQRMEFVLQRERMEAQRRLVEAEGIRDAQKVLSEGLSPIIIQWQSIEAFKQLSASPNTKILITDGKAPLIIQTDK
jgi:prohibitin 1